jgi:hypothetical protein
LQVVPRGQFIKKEKWYIKDKTRELFLELIGLDVLVAAGRNFPLDNLS